MCLDDDNESDEVVPNSVMSVDPGMRDVGSKRYHAMNQGKHLCLELGGL